MTLTVDFFAIVVFCLSYLLFVFLPRHRAWVAVAGAVVLLLTKTLSLAQALEAVNWNVLGIFVGTLVLADLFVESRMPAFLAENIINRMGSSRGAMLALCLFTGLISAVVENVATVLIVAPIALALARKLDISPVQLLIAMAVSSNLEGAATLVGDPPSMLLAGFAKMNFLDFFVYRGRPGIFFAVQCGAIASLVFLYFVFRRHRKRVTLPVEEKILSLVPTWLLTALIVGLAFSSLFDPDFRWFAGVWCLVLAAIGLAWDFCAQRGSFLERIRGLDWDTTFFLVGVFVLVGSLTATGWTERIAEFLSGLAGARRLVAYVMLVGIAVVVSGVVDNVPFLAAMLPVVARMGAHFGGEPTVLFYGLLLGASIGGNITPIGASANLVTIGILRREGFMVKFGEFMKLGLPFTFVSTVAAAAFVWIIFGAL